MANAGNTATTLHHDPPLLEGLFSRTRTAPVWIVARLYVGWIWLSVGWSLLKQPASTDTATAGSSWEPGAELLGGFTSWGSADWVVTAAAAGLTIAALAVILGVATGIAAFSGVVSGVILMATNAAILGPEVFALAMLLVLAWKTAGWIGLDRWVLPMLGVPWPGGFDRFNGEAVIRRRRLSKQ